MAGFERKRYFRQEKKKKKALVQKICYYSFILMAKFGPPSSLY